MDYDRCEDCAYYLTMSCEDGYCQRHGDYVDYNDSCDDYS